MDKIGIRTIVVNFDDEQLPCLSLVQGDAKTRGFDIVICDSDGKEIPPNDDYIVELVAVNSKDKDTPYACRHEVVDNKYRVMIPPEALSESGSVTIQLVFYQKSTKAVIHTIKQKCPVYQSIGQEFVESNNLYVDITALRLGIEKIAVMETAYLQVLEDEETRKSNEVKRESNESTRQSQESERVEAEEGRDTNEDKRIENESKRVTAEADRTVIFNEMTESLEDYKTPLATDTVAGKVKVDKIPTETGEITVPSVGKLSEEIQLISTQKDSTGSPGASQSFKMESMKTAFFGEVSSDELITGDDLALKVGLTAGNSVNSSAGWLKFMYKGKIQFVSKKHIRNSVTWIELNTADLVYGAKTVEIKGLTYKVRLLRGIGEDVQPDAKKYQPYFEGKSCHNSEWNTLMCPISDEAPMKWTYPENVNSPTLKSKKTYNGDELDMWAHRSWCQENAGADDSHRVVRGAQRTPSYSLGIKDSNALQAYSWRPVLELVG